MGESIPNQNKSSHILHSRIIVSMWQHDSDICNSSFFFFKTPSAWIIPRLWFTSVASRDPIPEFVPAASPNKYILCWVGCWIDKPNSMNTGWLIMRLDPASFRYDFSGHRNVLCDCGSQAGITSYWCKKNYFSGALAYTDFIKDSFAANKSPLNHTQWPLWPFRLLMAT